MYIAIIVSGVSSEADATGTTVSSTYRNKYHALIHTTIINKCVTLYVPYHIINILTPGHVQLRR